MWKYEKRLQYPVKIKQSNPQMAVRTEKLELPCVIFPSGIPCLTKWEKAF